MTGSIRVAVVTMTVLVAVPGMVSAAEIIRDAEYYVLEAQNAERWAADDEAVDKKLAEFREKNGDQPPNVLYILIDDIGFGDLGIPELNAIRGYKTPAITSSPARACDSRGCTPSRPARRPASPS
jgi:hypothetical protein